MLDSASSGKNSKSRLKFGNLSSKFQDTMSYRSNRSGAALSLRKGLGGGAPLTEM